MNEFHIHHAIGEISEELIDPVAKLRQKKRDPIVKWAAMAACLCLLLTLPWGWHMFGGIEVGSTNSESLMESPKEDFFDGIADNAAAADSASAAVFRAKVLEVHGSSGILVEPLAGETECSSSDRFAVSFGKLESIPQIQAGDIVEIVYDGMIQEIYPCRISGIIAIKVIG